MRGQQGLKHSCFTPTNARPARNGGCWHLFGNNAIMWWQHPTPFLKVRPAELLFSCLHISPPRAFSMRADNDLSLFIWWTKMAGTTTSTEERTHIIALRQAGLTIKETVAQVERHRATVLRILAASRSLREDDVPQPKPRPGKQKKTSNWIWAKIFV